MRGAFRRYLDKGLFFLSLGALVFVYGVATGRQEIFPYGTLNAAAYAAMDWAYNWKVYAGLEPGMFLRPARYEGTGVVVHESGKAFPGVTFMTGLFDGVVSLQLVDMDGSVLHRWPARVTELWPDLSHIEGEPAPIND